MGFPTLDLLAASADELQGRHPLTVVSIPALLRSAHEQGVPPTQLAPFGSAQENLVLASFKVTESKKPYLAVWGSPPTLVNRDYAGSTLQRLRTIDLIGRSVFVDDFVAGGKRTRFALQPAAGGSLATAQQPTVSVAALAVWLGRDQSFTDLEEAVAWFHQVHPFGDTDLAGFYTDAIPAALSSVASQFAAQRPSDAQILQRFDIPSEAAEPPATAEAAADVGEEDDLLWTREVCMFPLVDSDVDAIVDRVLADLTAHHIELPDARALVGRCVVALLIGNLVLQGPPGTGKTTLARALAAGFNCELEEATATSDWSPFHVVGGLRPNAHGGLAPAYGKVSGTALSCAALVREHVAREALVGSVAESLEPVVASPDPDPQAKWLFIDEFNRADIDKAVGSLYTLLSSSDPAHLERTPIDLWFETNEGRRRLWVPGRFRILAAMNDLDTSFVNRLSQGLTRRFQFVTVGVPTDRGTAAEPVGSELVNAFAGAVQWLDTTYGANLPSLDAEQTRAKLDSQLRILQTVVDKVRRPEGNLAGWPLGTAQVVDILRVLLLRSANATGDLTSMLDFALADRLVPQMSSIDDDQFNSYRTLFSDQGLPASEAALEHLLDPHAVT